MAAHGFHVQPSSHLFERNISLNDLDLALNVREIVRKDVVVPTEATKHRHLGISTSYSFVLPSFENFEDEFRKFVFSFLVDGHILRELETAKRLNWCRGLCRLVTVNTLGDGNCLMHAVSIGMWAVNDRYQTLRKTVYEALVEDVEGTRFYHSRWRAEENRQVLTQNGGYERTEEQWANEWEEVIRLASQTQFPFGACGPQYGSLEEIHIFVLANILRRTIIVASDETLRGQYDESYAPINFGGIYLPLWWDSIDCEKSPLVIGYADGHFTAVVSIDDGKLDLGIETHIAPTSSNCIHAVPLVKFDGTPLPVHFLYDHEEPMASDRLRQYLDCSKVSLPSNSGESRSTVVVAKVHFVEPPQCMKDLVQGYFAKARKEFQRVSKSRQLHNRAKFQPGIQQPTVPFVRCLTEGCEFYGSTETGNRCSHCLNEYIRTLGPSREPSPCAPARQPSTGEQQESVNIRATATSIDRSKAVPNKCHTIGCKYVAVPEQGGLCERCFDAEQSAAELTASMGAVQLVTAIPCANHGNGCQFFGLPHQDNLCSRCYRAFCLQMESSLGVASPTGLPPTSPTGTSAMGVYCQSPGCGFPGIPALYGMCVRCYTGCISSFVTKRGSSVGNASSSRYDPAPRPAHPPDIKSRNQPPSDVTNRNQLPSGAERKGVIPTGAGMKGVLCATPGCINEGVFQYKDLCVECYEGRPSSGNPGSVLSIAASGHFPVPQAPLNTVTTTTAAVPVNQMASGFPNHPVASAMSNPSNQGCDDRIPVRSRSGSGVTSQHSGLPVTTAAGSALLWTSTSPKAQRAPIATSARLVQQSDQRSAALLPAVSTSESAQDEPNLCILGCGKPAVEDNGLCQECYAKAFEFELSRESVQQSSRQQGATVSGSFGHQMSTNDRSRSAPTSPTRKPQPTEPEATGMKFCATKPLPCQSKGCMSFGTRNRNYLCEKCFRKKGNPPSTDPFSPQTTRSQGVDRGLGARPVQRNRHVDDSNEADALNFPVQVCQSQSPAYRSTELERFLSSGRNNVQGRECRQDNCPLFGTPEMNGYCSRCFLDITIPQSGPCSVPDFPSEAFSGTELSSSSLPVT